MDGEEGKISAPSRFEILPEIRRPFLSVMPGPSPKIPAPRKRTRKRKRRVASSSSSSSSEEEDEDEANDEDADEANEQPAPLATPIKRAAPSHAYYTPQAARPTFGLGTPSGSVNSAFATAILYLPILTTPQPPASAAASGACPSAAGPRSACPSRPPGRSRTSSSVSRRRPRIFRRRRPRPRCQRTSREENPGEGT